MAEIPPPRATAEQLADLALDLRWSWNHSADELWAHLDPELWALTHNPRAVLATVSRAKVEALLARPEYRARVETMVEQTRRALEAPAWFQGIQRRAVLTGVAYFSMEFGLSEALPIYSGGLGNVAGDQLKASSDLGVPLIGIGLLYQQGYFRQAITPEGEQHALYPYNDPGQLPVSPLRDRDGDWLRVPFHLPGFTIWLRAWEARVGRLRLYLLDSNDPANPPAIRGITSELYGAGLELRLRQELALGVGGWRLLRLLGLAPEVCHLNEGHAAFAVLERARAFMEDSGQPFEVALAVTRAGTLFTTHTPVAAGFDRFPPALVERYLGAYAETLGIDMSRLLALGRQDPDDPGEPFNMAYLAIRGSAAVNGVSQLHGQVSRRIFQRLFPRWPEAEVPVGHVTNGIHVPTWDSVEADRVWTTACGQERWRGTMGSVAEDIRRVPGEQLWAMRRAGRGDLVDYLRTRLAQHSAAMGGSPEEVELARHAFDPDALTLGFARRFAAYKRPTLLLHDPERLARLLTDHARPVQLVIAGKAHPADRTGQEMVKAWFQFIRRPGLARHVMFVPDYDLLLAEHLVQGVDLWINTPRRPWEASGTSGMKVLVNGGLNLSELDGWWAEAYSPEVGWALGDGREHGDDPAWDAAEADALYRLLEEEVVPAFYTRDARGLPAAWVRRMRESMAELTPRFSANRAVREYTELYYLPAATGYRQRALDKGALGAEIVAWQAELATAWPAVRFGEVRVETRDGWHHFTVEVHLGDLHPDLVRVELYADGPDDRPPTQEMLRWQRQLPGSGDHEYRGAVVFSRPPTDFTPRVVPAHSEAAIPLEAAEILWQR